MRDLRVQRAKRVFPLLNREEMHKEGSTGISEEFGGGVHPGRLPLKWGKQSGMESWALNQQRQGKVNSVMGAKAIVASKRHWSWGICARNDLMDDGFLMGGWRWAAY